MKKYLLLLLFALIYMPGVHAQSDTIYKYYNYNWKETEPRLATYYTVGYPSDSLWVRLDFYASNDRLQMKGRTRKKDLEEKVGPFTYFHENGNVQSMGVYHNDKKTGIWKSYSKDGKLLDSLYYSNGAIIKGKSFYESGEISEEWEAKTRDSVIHYTNPEAFVIVVII
jgi:antitoxin component YwqK of YwqJK toxin-antitoxin module